MKVRQNYTPVKNTNPILNAVIRTVETIGILILLGAIGAMMGIGHLPTL